MIDEEVQRIATVLFSMGLGDDRRAWKSAIKLSSKRNGLAELAMLETAERLRLVRRKREQNEFVWSGSMRRLFIKKLQERLFL